MTVPHIDPPGAVPCQHCPALITLAGAYWVDRHGIMVCEKYTGPVHPDAAPQHAGHLLHKPMPGIGDHEPA